MKKIALSSLFLFLFVGMAWGVGQENLAVNILDSQGLVKEIDGQAALPFYDEYKIRLVNHNDRKATAKVFIDGIPVSKLGDIIIPDNGRVDLERFLTHSLTEGARFKFVPLTDKRVDDPGRAENGLIRVEFKLERKIEIRPIEMPIYLSTECLSTITTTANNISTPLETMVMDSNTTLTSASLEKGATIGGGISDQKFQYAHVDLEDKVIVLELKLRGFNRYGYLR